MAQALLIADPKAVELVKNVNLSGSGNGNTTVQKHCIQVSNTKKPFFFYLKLAKKYIKQHDDVELSALGKAIPTVVTIAEILKADGLAVDKMVLTSTVGLKGEHKGRRQMQKPKLKIVLEKRDNSKSYAMTAEPKSNFTATEPEMDADRND